jgi:hypothetical protein
MMNWQEWQQDEVNRRIFLRGVQALAIAVAALYVLLYLTAGLE